MKRLLPLVLCLSVWISGAFGQASNVCFESFRGKDDAKQMLTKQQFKDYRKWFRNPEKFADLNPCYNSGFNGRGAYSSYNPAEKPYPSPLDKGCVADLSQFEDSDTYLYVTAIGESLGHQESLTNAKALARQELEIDRRAYVNVGIMRYVKDEMQKALEEGTIVSDPQSYNKLEREVIQVARGFTANVILVCNETYKTDEGYFKTYVRMAMEKDALYEQIARETEIISGNLKLEFDKDSFSEKMRGKYQEYIQELEKEINRLKKN